MVAQNTAETDDQIIDLTELIEKGAVPDSDPSETTPHVDVAPNDLEDHLRNLNDGTPPAVDADIDDLLAQMDMKDADTTAEDTPAPTASDIPTSTADMALDFSAPSTKTDHPIDPNEELLMPGMGEVDNLLNSLDIPPQPGERITKPAESAPGADQAVDDLLNAIGEPPAAPQPQNTMPDAIPDLDDLLAAGSQTSETPASSELDDLLREGSPQATQPQESAPVAPAAAAPAAPADDITADLDSLLAAVSGGQEQRPAPAAPSAPVAPEVPAAPTAAAPAASADDITADLDSLLAAVSGGQEQSPAPAAPSAPAAHEAPAAPTPAAPTAAAPTAAAPAASADDITADLDSLLAAVQAETKIGGTEPQTVQETAPIQEEPLVHAGEMAAPATDLPPEAQEATLRDMPEESPGELPETLESPISSEEAVTEPVLSDAGPEAFTTDAEQIPSTEELSASSYGNVSSIAAAAASAATAAATAALETVMHQATEASSHAVDAFEQAFAATSKAAEVSDAVAQLGARLEHCENALHEAGERIIALETAVEGHAAVLQQADLSASAEPSIEAAPALEPSALIEDIFTEGHPLHQKLMDSIALAVRQALEAEPVAGGAPDSPEIETVLNERLQPLDTEVRSSAARLDALEGRLDALEPRFNDRVERAAAAAAARILREEIARLLENQ